MGEFTTELTRRIRDEYASLSAARAAADDDLTETHLSELENLQRIAADHGVPLPAA
jgi:hypothetical protein